MRLIKKDINWDGKPGGEHMVILSDDEVKLLQKVSNVRHYELPSFEYGMKTSNGQDIIHVSITRISRK